MPCSRRSGYANSCAGNRLGCRVQLGVLLGAVTPLCSCSTEPLCIGFVEAGIPLLVIVSFLIADPMINVVAVVLLSGIVGWQPSTLYVAGDLVGALFGCILMQRLRPERWVEDYVWQVRMGDAAQVQGDTNPAGRHRYALEDVRQSVSRIWKWVLACNALGGMLHGYARHGRVSGHLDGHNRWSVPLAVTLYSDTTGVIPIALAMLDKGVMLGAALALPEMLILRKIIPWPALALYSTLLAASFTLLGWASNPIG